jgi:hypothetical protein
MRVFGAFMHLRSSSVALILVLAATARGQASLTGYVRDDESLRGLQGVELAVDGSDRKVRTDKEGKYTLKDLTPGSVRLHVRFLGFAPIDTIVTLDASKPTESVFFLSKRAIALDTVKTRDVRVAGAGFESFEIRRSKGFGKFIDSVELRQMENRQLSELVRERATLQIVVPSTCHGSYPLWCNWRVAARQGRATGTVCAAQIVLDGQIVARGAVIPNADAPWGSPPAVLEAYQRDKERAWGKAFDLNSIGVSSLQGVEIYRSAADAQDIYGGDDAGCGVVVLWTRRGR